MPSCCVATNVVELAMNATKEGYTSLACSMLTNFCVVIKQQLAAVVKFHNLIQNVRTDVKDIVLTQNAPINVKILVSLVTSHACGAANTISVQEGVLKVVTANDAITHVHISTSVVTSALVSVGNHAQMCVTFVMKRNFHSYMCP